MQFALGGCKLLSTYFDYVMSGRLAKTTENMKLLKNELEIEQVLGIN